MNRLLLIIDAQEDFLEGSLRMEGATERMDRLAEYIQNHDGQYQVKVFTKDWHPLNHCSFDRNGGPWPVHCLNHSAGAGIHQSLLIAAYSTKGDTVVLTKGDNPQKEEYSIFDNEASSARLRQIVDEYAIDQIDVCGVAREYCVKESILGAIKVFGPDRLCLLDRYIGAISDDHALDEIVEAYHLRLES